MLSLSIANEDDEIWRRDCYEPSDGFIGCSKEEKSNGTMTWTIDICICKEPNCNEKMGSISSSTTPTTTTTHKGKLFIKD